MNTTETKSEISKPAKRSWRKHSDEFKARVIAQALQPYASLASVAMANGINANMLRNWVHASSLASGPVTAIRDDRNNPALSFVQLPMQVDTATPAASVTSPIIEVQIQRGETRVVVSLPLITDSAAWVREVLG
jgi:transposase-like protein